MKKRVSFEKEVEFPTMIGEICEIELDHDLKFINDTSVEGNFLLSGKYKMTEASRLETDFNYKIPVEIELTEKLDLSTTNIEISDFYYEIENENIVVCHIELLIDGLEIIDDGELNVVEERECDGDLLEEKEIEIPVLEKTEDVSINEVEKPLEDNSTEVINSLFSNLNDETDTYGTFIVYIVRQNETLNSIIEKYHTNVEEVEKYNDIKDINVGTKLIIPLLNE